MFRHLAGVATLLFGLASIVGGILGFVGEKKSTASLVAGGLSGVILLLCGVGIFKGPKQAFISLLGALVLALALVGFFVYDSIKHWDNLGAFFQTTLGETAVVMICGGLVVSTFCLAALYRRAR
jgi:uncharacterized membrane protein (UPF0136 family)